MSRAHGFLSCHDLLTLSLKFPSFIPHSYSYPHHLSSLLAYRYHFIANQPFIKMKEAVYGKDLHVEIRNVPRPSPGPGQVLIRTVVSGTNPKDWKYPKYWAAPDTPASNHGDDVAGYVEDVGEGVVGFHPGDRVAAFHEIGTPNGSFAEYCIARAQSTFQLPETTCFEGLYYLFPELASLLS